MIINQIHFPIYGVIILVSIGMGMFYIYHNIEKEKRKNLYLYFILYLSFALIFGKLFTILTSFEKVDILTAGISSLGGVIGTILAAYIYEKIENHENKVMKYTILSLPLVYGLSKIACFLVGCCYGIPYDGIGYVIYPAGLNEKLFPIQMVETIVFLLIFILLHKNKEKKGILTITLLVCTITKFLLDFLRYDHIKKIFTINQIVCMIFMGVIVFLYFKKGKKNEYRRVKTKTN